MKKYQYQILRYVHDQFTGEFVNLGVVVYSPEDLFLQVSVSQRYSRVTALFPDANGKFISKLVKNFETSIKRVSKELSQLFRPSENLAAITRTILPQDDSSLMLTNVMYAIDIDLEIALKDLHYDLVEKYLDITTGQSLTDDDVWRKKYKSYFDNHHITNRLINHDVSTRFNVFSFDKSWKNEIWHCYQPISFDLQSREAINNKVHKWSGILREMDTVKEKIHITFLATLSNDYKKLNDFISQSLNQDSEFIKVDIILDSEAETIAKEVSHQIKQHDESF